MLNELMKKTLVSVLKSKEEKIFQGINQWANLGKKFSLLFDPKEKKLYVYTITKGELEKTPKIIKIESVEDILSTLENLTNK